MNVGVVILLAAFCFKMMLILGQQFVGLIVSHAMTNYGHESLVTVLAVSNGLGMVGNLALAVGCVAMATDKRALPFGILSAVGWISCGAAAAASYFLDVHHELITVGWIAASVGALTLTVAGAEAVRGEIRGLWVGAVGVGALLFAAVPTLAMKFVDEANRFEIARGVYFLADIMWITLMIVILVVTIVPALNPEPSRHRP